MAEFVHTIHSMLDCPRAQDLQIVALEKMTNTARASPWKHQASRRYASQCDATSQKSTQRSRTRARRDACSAKLAPARPNTEQIVVSYHVGSTEGTPPSDLRPQQAAQHSLAFSQKYFQRIASTILQVNAFKTKKQPV